MSSLSSAAVPAPAQRPPLRLSQLGDELLARYAARGSERAFATLYERYHQQLYRYCRSILRHDLDAQDALQTTFASALQALRRNQRNAPLRPWLYRIAHNEAISVLRRRSRDATDELDADSLGVGSSVEQQAADRARWTTLVGDIGLLPDRQRGALLLRELSGLSHEEIAIALRTSTAGAKQAIFEARQALAEFEEGRAMQCEEVRRQISEGDRRMLRGRRVGAHLRECAACDAFALAIPARRTQLAALTPVLPSAAAATVLARSLQAASSQGGAGGTSAAATAGIAGKAAGTAVAWKALAGAAILATTAAGVSGVSHLVAHSHAAPRSAPVTNWSTGAVSHARSGVPNSARSSLLYTHSGLARAAANARHGQGTSGQVRSVSHRSSHPARTHRSGHAYGAPVDAGSVRGHSSSSSRGGSGHATSIAQGGAASGQHAQASVSPTQGSGSQTVTPVHPAKAASVGTGTVRAHKASARTHRARH
jgi:RNA polymerase sigma factor (sigma-70 family)